MMNKMFTMKNKIIIGILIIAMIIGGFIIIKLNKIHTNKKEEKNIASNSSKQDIPNSRSDSLNLDEIEENTNIEDENSMNEFIIEVNNKKLIVEVEENSATKALFEKLKQGDVVITAHDYGNFEKVGDLGFSLPKEDVNITTKAGDVVLYQGNQISLFYNSNTWSYTKLGTIKNVSSNELKNILGNGDVTLTFSLSK